MVEARSNQECLAVPKPRRAAKRMVFLIALAGWMIVIALGLFLVGAVQDAREAARGSQCRGHFSQLAMAFHNYHDSYGCLPPAFIADANGKPMHSWRVLILEFLSHEERAIHQQYDFSEPWDGPNNRHLAGKIPLALFQCPSGPHYEKSLMTDYVVIVGSKTAFPGSRSTTFDDFPDGRENTIFLVEIANSNIHWMEPRDLNFEAMSFAVNDSQRPSISSLHPCGPGVVFADGISALRLNQSLRSETLKALVTIAGHEPVTTDKLIRLDEKCDRCLAE